MINCPASYKYQLPKEWVDVVKHLKEFSNGGTQVSVRLKSGEIHNNILISNSSHIIAMRNHKKLPFEIDQIADIYQNDEDLNPANHGGWYYWDEWKS